MPLKNIILTGSIGSIPTQSYGQKMYISSTEQQSFPIERITGSSGGTFPEFNKGYSTTGLFVNVTQSYSESIDTIAGIRTFLHDTQEEFINGEFSGSKLIVADQRLIDEDCVEFLNVNTTLINYKTYFYYKSASLYNSTPIENFLNSNTSPNDGEIYLYWSYTEKYNNPNVKYNHTISNIKIARKDTQGNNNTLSLQELTNLRLKFSDVSSVTDYPITTITERPTYYLYTLSSIINVTSSADNNVINHAFSASGYTSYPPASVFLNTQVNLLLNGVETTDAANYFTTSTGDYTFGDTPNHIIYYTASALFTPTGTQTMYFGLYPITSSFTTISVPTTITFSGSASFTENTNIFMFANNFSLFTGNITSYSVSNVQCSFTQSLNPNTASTLTVLEPYLTNTFKNTDCDVTMNNVSEQEVSGLYRKVNYNSGATIPTNQEQIISQSAEFADVKDYNYSARAHILPRYNGVRTVQKEENIYTLGEYSIDGKDTVDVGFGKTPSVQSLGTYFAYFDYLGGTNPELIDKTAAHIVYLIDIDGNILIPSISSSYYYNLIDNFQSNKNVNIIMNSISGSDPTIFGKYPVIRAGTIPMPIIASQTGSGFNIQPTMSFGNDNIPDFYGSFGTLTSQTIAVYPGGAYQTLTLSNSFIPNTSKLLLASDIITIQSTSNKVKIKFQVTLKGITATNAIPPSNPSFTYIKPPLIVLIHESTNSFSTFNTYYTQDIIVPNFFATPQQDFIFTTFGEISPISGKEYRIQILNTSTTWDIIIGSCEVSVFQNPTSRLIITSGETFFTSNTLPSNTLTGSYSMSLAYSPNNPIKQRLNTTHFSSSGYFPFLPFTIQPGDQIRFEGDESQAYEIISATPQFGNVSMSILLNGDITAGTDINSFLIRRNDPNPNFITIDTDLTTYTGGGGFILPEHITNELQENFNKNIVSLKERGLIT
jgi:hypothetical protein